MSKTPQVHIPLADVESSQIHSIGHDPDTNTLAVRFRKGYGAKREPGALSHYANVSSEQFAAFRDADSLGKHFGTHFKPHRDKHPFVRIDEAHPTKPGA